MVALGGALTITFIVLSVWATISFNQRFEPQAIQVVQEENRESKISLGSMWEGLKGVSASAVELIDNFHKPIEYRRTPNGG